ncbi:MAG TPA: hypothetical protein VK475_09850, partial [Pyrinomonadaceae bacterium]|nr:hypothetical protein [Pyrinomonadaceae bacterium]
TLAIIYLETANMSSGWAGLPGFLLTLPLSVLVAAGYLLASYAAEVLGYNIHVTEYQTEYGYIVCAFLNAFIFYPVYRWWFSRRHSQVSEPPPPPDFKI